MNDSLDTVELAHRTRNDIRARLVMALEGVNLPPAVRELLEQDHAATAEFHKAYTRYQLVCTPEAPMPVRTKRAA